MAQTVASRIYNFEEPFLFVVTPDGVDQTLSSFLDDQALLVTAQVCKVWKENAALKKERVKAYEDRACIALGYPQEMVLEFRMRQISIWNLPILDLGDYEDDIDRWHRRESFKIEKLTSSIMRFEDSTNGVGLIFKIKKIQQIPVNANPDTDGNKDEYVILHQFLKYTALANWSFKFESTKNIFHITNHPHPILSHLYNPHGPRYLEFTANLLDGGNKDPFHQLSGSIVSVDNPIPEIIPSSRASIPNLNQVRQDEEETEEAPISCVESAYTTIFACFSSILSSACAALNRFFCQPSDDPDLSEHW
jgi:hypothetical protein